MPTLPPAVGTMAFLRDRSRPSYAMPGVVTYVTPGGLNFNVNLAVLCHDGTASIVGDLPFGRHRDDVHAGYFYDVTAPGTTPDLGQIVVYKDHSMDPSGQNGAYRRAAVVTKSPSSVYGAVDVLVFDTDGTTSRRLGVPAGFRPSGGYYDVAVGRLEGSMVHFYYGGNTHAYPAIVTALADRGSPAASAASLAVFKPGRIYVPDAMIAPGTREGTGTPRYSRA